jgi:predicted transcriptional regulator
VKQRTASADRQNVTLSLPRPLLKRVKVLAAEEDKSMSQLMEEALEERVRRRAAYEQARRRHLRVLERGFDLGTGGRLQVSRDELHERQ